MSKSSNEESGGEATTSESRKALGAARPKHESCTSDGLSQEIAMSDDDGVTAAAESLVMASAEMGGRFSRFHSKAMFDTMDKEDQASSISRKRSKSPLSSANLSKGKRSAKPTSSKGAAGRWTKEEHEAFLEGLNIHGREWKKVAERITTRTSAQIRSHAQKYFSKLAKDGTYNYHDLEVSNSSEFAQDVSVDGDDNGSYVAASVISKIAKITKDPNSVQQEVENTLRMLHERYRELQLQIHAAQQRQQGQWMEDVSSFLPSVPRTTACESTLEMDNFSYRKPAAAAVELEELQVSDSALRLSKPCTPDEMVTRETCSSNSLSSLDSMTAATTTRRSPNRDLISEELIAVEVLRGGLPSRKRKTAHISEEDMLYNSNYTIRGQPLE